MFLYASGCSSDSLTTSPQTENSRLPASALVELTCIGNIRNATIACQAPSVTPSLSRRANLISGISGIKPSVIGGQHVNVNLTSSNVSYNAGTEIFQFDATVQNLLNEALGSINGITPDTGGVKVFFYQPPTATSGSGAITILGNDGTGTFNGSNQAYYKYPGMLIKSQVSAPRTWQFSVPSTVDAFVFTVYVEATNQAMIVINEILANPGGTISDANGEWFEVYNAGTRSIDMQGFLISDSSAAGRRPYHLISSSVIVPPGGYVVFGNTTNTTNNGGVPIDYAYGAALALTNSIDAVKISYVRGTDTLTIDYVRYGAVTSAQNGISRELKNPSLDNVNMDGSNWGDASVTSVYGTGGRGTPKMKNSAFVP